MKKEFTLVLAGDLFPTEINEELFVRGETEKLVDEKIREIISRADYAVCNLEGCFFDGQLPEVRRKDGDSVKASSKAAPALKKLGFSLVSLANNHVTDCGSDGYFSTVRTLEDNEIRWAGAGPDAEHIRKQEILQLPDGKKVCIYAVSEALFNEPSVTEPGANVYDEYRVCHELEQLKRENDYVLVMYHGGVENFSYNTQQVVTRFRRMADSGADFIVSQHTHAIGLEEYYHGSYLLYGQGNFLYHFRGKPSSLSKKALLLELKFGSDGLTVCKHLVRKTEYGVGYDPGQDLSDFEERSRRWKEGDSFTEERNAYFDVRAGKRWFLEALRGINENDAQKKEEDREGFSEYLKTKYSLKQLYRIYKFIHMEEFREIAEGFLLQLIEKKKEEIAEKAVRAESAEKPENGKNTEDVKNAAADGKHRKGLLPFSTEAFSLTELDLKAIKKWKRKTPEHLENLTEERFADMLKRYRRFGSSAIEYDFFGFDSKTDEECSQYVTLVEVKLFYKSMLKSSAGRKLLRDKYRTYEKLKEFYKRDMIPKNDRKAFLNFCRKHDTFVAKPSSGTGGHGILFVDLKETGLTPEEYFDRYLDEKGYDIEETLIQRPEMSVIYPGSINTVRPVTYRSGGKVHFIFTIMRIGQGGNRVDNLSSGGLCVQVDSETGTVISDAVSRLNSDRPTVHPDTGVTFRGFQIPEWDKLKQTVTDAALRMADPPFIGWDMAYGEKGWCIIEANWAPTNLEIQMLAGKGIKKNYTDLVGTERWPSFEKYRAAHADETEE